MPADLDPLDGIELDGASVLRVDEDVPGLSVLRGDLVIAHEASEVDDGRFVVVIVERRLTVGRWPCPGQVVGIVAGIVRRVGDA